MAQESWWRHVRLARGLLERAHHAILAFGILWALALLVRSPDFRKALVDVVAQMDWALRASLLVLLVALALRAIIGLLLWRTESAEPAAPGGATADSVRLTADWATEQELPELTSLTERAFPRGLRSRVDYAKKLATYRRWRSATPFAARLIRRRSDGRAVGFTIAVRLERSRYLQYRNGDATPWDWSELDFVPPESEDHAYVFFQTLHCDKHAGRRDRGFLTQQVLVHLATLTQGRSFTAITPRITKSGRRGAEQLGFERCRRSEAGFELYELDARREEELAADARELLARVRATWQDRALPAAN